MPWKKNICALQFMLNYWGTLRIVFIFLWFKMYMCTKFWENILDGVWSMDFVSNSHDPGGANLTRSLTLTLTLTHTLYQTVPKWRKIYMHASVYVAFGSTFRIVYFFYWNVYEKASEHMCKVLGKYVDRLWYVLIYGIHVKLALPGQQY